MSYSFCTSRICFFFARLLRTIVDNKSHSSIYSDVSRSHDLSLTVKFCKNKICLFLMAFTKKMSVKISFTVYELKAGLENIINDKNG